MANDAVVKTTCERHGVSIVVQAGRPRCEHVRAGLCALSEINNMRKCYYPDTNTTTSNDHRILHPPKEVSAIKQWVTGLSTKASRILHWK